ncbi:MAG: NAD(P) transhydrogenase subunit alpha [Rhodothermales bacterium]|jgi:NAD(P) transhydrogenase subunit alpha
MENLPVTEAAEVASMANGQVFIYLLFILALSVFLGFELIAKVPSTLHTPLMSGANAISGITIVGAITAAGLGSDKGTIILGTLAVTFATINVVGGYLVTDRMLAMFSKKGADKP